jgi:putative redox protein
MGGGRTVGELASGPNPYDLLGASLAACTAMTIRLYAERKELPLVRVQVGVAFRHGSPGTRDVFDRIIFLEGDLNQQQRERMVQIGELCPVGKTLGVGADINTVLCPVGGPEPVPSVASDYMSDAQELPDINVEW